MVAYYSEFLLRLEGKDAASLILNERNVFIGGHYLGWPGTASHLVFYNLDKLQRRDEVVLEDSWRQAYRYRVSEAFEARPEESWVMGQEVGRDMLTLQTCSPPPSRSASLCGRIGLRALQRADYV